MTLFADLKFEEALARAGSLGRFLLVDATATWCGPCRLMERTTWRDPEVIAWVEAHAVAIQVDVDEQQAVAQALGIQAMPTMILFERGEEKDRAVGLKRPAEMLAWLQGVARGETSVDQVRSALADPEHDMRGRLSLAKSLLQARKLDEALGHYDWLWRNLHRVEPAMSGVRVSFMAGEIQALCQQSPAARRRFSELRDQADAAAGADGEAGRESRFDWVVLNQALGEVERTLAWFDGIKDDAGYAPLLAQLSHWLVPLLRRHERWADIGRLVQHPLAQLRRDHGVAEKALERVPEQMRDQLAAAMKHHFRDQAGLLGRALEAAGRAEEAAAVKGEALRLDPSDEMKAALAGGGSPLPTQ
jgi:thiol-disulfide isomerase/thioredoxin